MGIPYFHFPPIAGGDLLSPYPALPRGKEISQPQRENENEKEKGNLKTSPR